MHGKHLGLAHFCVVFLLLLRSFLFEEVFCVIGMMFLVICISIQVLAVNLDAFILAVADIKNLVYPASKAPVLYRFNVPTYHALIV